MLRSQAVNSVARTSFLAVVMVGAVFLLAARLWLARDLPLWLDESWTAAIAAQQMPSALFRELQLDANAPLYYVVMWLLPGDSSFLLRLPSLVFVVAAAALPSFWRAPISRDTAITWGALIFFWAPGLVMTADARAYGMLLFMATAQSIAFARLLEQPKVRTAAIWAIFASAAILTHYLAAFVVALQGAFYLMRHRKVAVSTWPAALVFVPSGLWTLSHLPRLMEFAAPGVAWQGTISPATAIVFVHYAIGQINPLFALGVAAIALLGWKRGAPIGESILLTAATGFVAIVVMLALATMQPYLVERYLTPTVPPILLGLAALVRTSLGRVALVVWFLTWTSYDIGKSRSDLVARSAFGLEAPLRRLAREEFDELLFSLDYPGAAALDRGTMSMIGSDMARRVGREIPATFVLPGADAWLSFSAASRRPRPALIWLYGSQRRAVVAQPASGWRCLDQASRNGGTLICVRE